MATNRIHSPFFLLVGAAFAAYIVFHVGPIFHCYFTGKSVEGEIVRYVPRKDDEGRRIHEYIVAFDGHEARRRFRRMRALGEKFSVTYRAGNPDSMIKGSNRDSIPSIVRQNVNLYTLSILGFFCAASLAAGFGWGQTKKRESVVSTHEHRSNTGDG